MEHRVRNYTIGVIISTITGHQLSTCACVGVGFIGKASLTKEYLEKPRWEAI